MVHPGLFAQFLNEPWGKLKILDLIYKPDATNPTKPRWGGEGALNFFFQVGVCGLDFQSVGLVNWYLPLKEGACQLKISKLAWELKYGQNWGCRGQNFQIFSKGGRSCELSLLLEMGSLWTKGEVWKGGLQRRTSPYRLSSSVPPLPPRLNPIFLKFKKNSSLWVQWDWMSGPFSQLKKDNSKYCTIQKGFETDTWSSKMTFSERPVPVRMQQFWIKLTSSKC